MDTPAMVSSMSKFIPVELFAVDVIECSTNKGGCAQTCTNTAGSYYCTCGAGYSLASNKHGCNGMLSKKNNVCNYTLLR